jgi:hypothetical protein
MTPIPLDDTAPITCTITSDEIPDRVELVEQLRRSLTAVERTDTGLVLRFEPTAANEADIRRFAVDEKRCCQFWGFDVTTGDHEYVLQWDGPAASNQLLDRLHSYFAGDEPLTVASGLL